jgi:hypothetical protein
LHAEPSTQVGAGQVGVELRKQMPVATSQQLLPPVTGGQLAWQSASAWQIGTHEGIVVVLVVVVVDDDVVVVLVEEDEVVAPPPVPMGVVATVVPQATSSARGMPAAPMPKRSMRST